MSKYFLYRHIRLDKNEPFYIGIGTQRRGFYERAFVKYGRNKHWNSITKNTPFKVEIVFETNNRKELLDKEVEFIKLYGRKKDGGTLVNYTMGGDGVNGNKVSQELREKLSFLNTGKKHPQYGTKASESTKQKQRLRKLGSNNTSSIAVYCKNNNKVYESLGRAAEDIYGKSDMSKKISDILKGKRKSYLGFEFSKHES